MRFSKLFYDTLRKKSQERGWQSGLARASGISQAALSKIISGKTKDPGIETVSAIIDALCNAGDIYLPSDSDFEGCPRCRSLETEIIRLMAQLEFAKEVLQRSSVEALPERAKGKEQKLSLSQGEVESKAG